MCNFRNSWLIVLLLGVAGFALTALKADAGDDKKGAVLSKAGELKPDDPKDTKLKDSPSQKFPIKLVEGKSYQIDLVSKDFDSYLRLENSEGKEVAFDDDGGGFPNARIKYKADKGGEYKIVVTSYDTKAGKFMLTVVEAGAKAGIKDAPKVGVNKGAPDSVVQAGAKDTPKVGASMFQGKTIPLTMKAGKASYTGELTDVDLTVRNHYFKIFTVQLEAGKTYRIDQKDAGDDAKFDPFLFLEDAAGATLEQDDDSGGNLNSRIVFKAAKTGTYRLITTTLPAKQAGKFTLEVGPASAEEAKEADVKFRINNFLTLSDAQRKDVVKELSKRFRDKGEDLTINDARLAFQFSMVVEDDPAMAREVLKDYIKTFGAASNKQLAGLSKQFEKSLQSLDKIGKPMEVTGKLTNGKDYDLSKFKGKVVLVDFWATWCGPCIAELPNMEAAYAKYHSKGFEIIGISLDRAGDEEKLTTFMENRKMPWPCINIEDSRKLANQYQVNSIPYPVLIDQEGNVVSFRARGPQLERLLEKLLDKK